MTGLYIFTGIGITLAALALIHSYIKKNYNF